MRIELDDYMPKSDYAKLLGVTSTWVEKLINTNKVKIITHGTRILIYVSEEIKEKHKENYEHLKREHYEYARRFKIDAR